MKGKIDSNGLLYIYRENFYKIQYCPYGYNQSVFCGDWCPLFGEPEKCKIGLKEYWKIEICCKKTLIFDELIDERGENENEN